jgi:hypothetical protein
MASRSLYWVSYKPFTLPTIADIRRFGAGVAYSNVSLFWTGLDTLHRHRLMMQCNYSLNPYILPGTKVLPSSQKST